MSPETETKTFIIAVTVIDKGKSELSITNNGFFLPELLGLLTIECERLRAAGVDMHNNIFPINKNQTTNEPTTSL